MRIAEPSVRLLVSMIVFVAGVSLFAQGVSEAKAGVAHKANPMPELVEKNGHHARVDFVPTGQGEGTRLFLSVEVVEPTADGGWKTLRMWNGDQKDYGLNLKAEWNVVLRVRLTAF